jgi:hypothetical protein
MTSSIRKHEEAPIQATRSPELVGQELSVLPQEDSRRAKNADRGITVDSHALQVSADAMSPLNHVTPAPQNHERDKPTRRERRQRRQQLESRIFGSSHERKITDPFVHDTDTGDTSSLSSPLPTRTMEDKETPPISYIQVPSTSGFLPPESASVRLDQMNNASSSAIDANRIQITAGLAVQLEHLHLQGPGSISGSESNPSSGTMKATQSFGSDSIQKYARREGESRCGICNHPNHTMERCPVGKSCANCGRLGHSKQHCLWKVHCGSCMRSGHREAECSRSCVSCGLINHNAADCQREPLCEFCGLVGHFRENCPLQHKAVREHGPDAWLLPPVNRTNKGKGNIHGSPGQPRRH